MAETTNTNVAANTETTNTNVARETTSAANTTSATTNVTASEKSYTETQIQKMLNDKEAESQGALYKELGIDPKNAQMLKAIKAFTSSQKTDEQVAFEQKSEHEAQIETLQHKLLVAETKAEMMKAGLDTKYVDDATFLVLGRYDGKTEIATLIGELKTKYQDWFVDKTLEVNKGKRVGEKGTGVSIANIEKLEQKEDSFGKRLAVAKKGANPKKSMWST